MNRNHKCQLWTIAIFLFLITTFPLAAIAQQKLPVKLKTSLNAYSFNGPLMKGEMNLYDLLEYCAANQFDAVDITAKLPTKRSKLSNALIPTGSD